MTRIIPNANTTGMKIVVTSELQDEDEALLSICCLEQLQDDWGVTDTVLTGITSDVTTAGTASLVELTTSATAAAASTYELAQQPRTDVVNMVAAVANTLTSNAADAIAFDRTAWIG